MYKINWTSIDIYSNDDAKNMVMLFNQQKKDIIVAGFDTETDTVKHMRANMFLFQFGWVTKDLKGYTFAVDVEQQPILSRQVIRAWNKLAQSVPAYAGHNIKYDLHVLINFNEPYEAPNVVDTMSLIRLGTDNIPTRKGGAPLGLKEFATRYIDRNAANFEKELDAEKSKLTSEYNMMLQRRLGWTKGKLVEFFKDKLNDADDLPDHLKQNYYDWVEQDLPLYLQKRVTGYVEKDMISYATLNRKNVRKYGHMDIVLLLEAYVRLVEVIEVRGNQHAVELECNAIYPVLRMERVGFLADKEYLEFAKKETKKYILERRQDLKTLAGRDIKVGQHELVRTVLEEMGVALTSTRDEEMSRTHAKLKQSGENPIAVEFIETVQELRTLEKWYSTYILRFIVDLRYSNMLYTTINTSGTVSGRVTSDFQQFPKGSIKRIDGTELYSPRRLFLVPIGYKGIVYLDYSQIELRLQAMFTILVGHADLNLCRAYSPYKCFAIAKDGTHIPYDYNNIWCIKNAYNITWYYDERPDTAWTPLDVHGATTKAAFNIDESDPSFHDLRYIGKRVNFAKNYGAQQGKIEDMFPEYDIETIQRIDQAYYKAFPGVKEYHNYCNIIAATKPYAQNLFGVRYFGVTGHNLKNMLIQGTGAYYLKWKICQVDAYLKEHNYKSKIQMQIHDELSFVWHPDDPPEVFFEVKKIMEDWEDTYIPIIADMEVTYKTWADKVEVNTVEELIKAGETT